jgi:hypothetical protein
VAELDNMAHQFIASIDTGRGTEWMKAVNAYAFSKISVNALVWHLEKCGGCLKH